MDTLIQDPQEDSYITRETRREDREVVEEAIRY